NRLSLVCVVFVVRDIVLWLFLVDLWMWMRWTLCAWSADGQAIEMMEVALRVFLLLRLQ
ncbi:hypothetical protein HKBW3S42_01064, partial [Candidatus Hakubella thermalkaliphila]